MACSLRITSFVLVFLNLPGFCFGSSSSDDAKNDTTQMFDAWCQNAPNAQVATHKLVSDLKAKMGNRVPAALFLGATTDGLDAPQVASELQKAFPDTPIWGTTSALGIFMNNGKGYMKGNVVGVLALCSHDYKCVVVGDELQKDNKNLDKATRQAIEKVKQQANNQTPDMVLLTSDPGPHEEKIIEFLKTEFGRDLPIFGGSAGAEAPNLRYAIANGKAYPKGFSLCFFFTSKTIGSCYQMGYKREPVTGVATGVNGRWITTIDGRPALEVYNEWTGGYFNKLLKSGGSIRGAGQMYHPLAVVKKSKNGDELIISLSAHQHDTKSGAIEFFACVNQGDTLTVLKGDTDSLIRRAYLGVAKAKRMARGRIAGGLVFYCSGARLLLEKEGRTGDMAPHLSNAFKDKPFMLMFNNGEHGSIPGSESFHGNLMLDAIVFGQ